MQVLLFHHFAHRESAAPELAFSFFNDHYRHMRFAWEARDIGTGIYSTPMRDFARVGDQSAYAWIDSPYLYPPGALAVFTPFAVLQYSGFISSTHAANALVWLFATAAALATYLFWRLRPNASPWDADHLAWLGATSALCLHATGWALHGQYDSLVAVVILVGAAERRHASRVLFLGLSFFLKFQALLLIPMFASEVALSFSTGEWRSKRGRSAVVVGAGLSAITIGIVLFLLARGALQPEAFNPIKPRRWSSDLTTILAAAFTVITAAVAVRKRQFLAAGTMLWSFSIIASLAQFQAWYLLFLYGMVPYLPRRGSTMMILWILGFTFLIGWFPSPHRGLEELLVLPLSHR